MRVSRETFKATDKRGGAATQRPRLDYWELPDLARIGGLMLWARGLRCIDTARASPERASPARVSLSCLRSANLALTGRFSYLHSKDRSRFDKCALIPLFSAAGPLCWMQHVVYLAHVACVMPQGREGEGWQGRRVKGGSA